MRFSKPIVLGIALALASPFAAEGAGARYDGGWDTILNCPDSHGALGFAFRFTAQVTNGVYHGEKGTKGQRGWYSLDGPIHDDGSASLFADGLVGSAPYAVDRVPAGSEYSYYVTAHFDGTQGTGERAEGRPCSVTFSKVN